MRNPLLIVILFAALAACDQLPFPNARKTTQLTEKQFIEVYVRLAHASSPEEKARILEEAGTTRAELDEFVKVYLTDLPAFSQVFDSVVARMGESAPPQIPTLPAR